MWGLTRYLHRKLIDAKQVERYVSVNLALVLKARIGKRSKEIGQGLLKIY